MSRDHIVDPFNDGKSKKQLSQELVQARNQVVALSREIAQLKSERECGAELLRKGEWRASDILESMTDAFYAVDEHWRLTYVNRKTEESWGRSRKGLIGQVIWDLFSDYEQTTGYRQHLRAMKERVPVNFEAFSPNLNFWAEVNLYPTPDGGLSAYFRDITARKRSEEALRKSEQRYRSLFQSSEAFVLLDPVLDAEGRPVDFRYLEVNDAGARMRNRSPDELKGRTILEVLPRLDPYWIEAYGQVWMTGQPVRFERRNPVTKRWYRTYAYCPEKGKVASLIVDITDRIQAEQALQELTEKLEELVAERTELAENRARQLQALAVDLIEAEERERQRVAELLHDDLQQILASARMQLRSVCETMTPDPTLVHVDRLLKESIAKSRSLSHELSPAVLHHSGLVAALQWLARQMNEQFGLKVDLELEMDHQFESTPLKLFIFRAVQELLFNVVKHAEVKAARVVLAGSDDNLAVIISDHGRGFNRGELHSSAGTGGFGLLSIRERARHVGGDLSVESAPGNGCRLLLTIPFTLPEGVTTQCFASTERRPIAANRKTRFGAADVTRVVFADDHKVMREGLIRLVANQPSIKVVGEAADGRQALEQARHLHPDVVVMDVSMPVMDGVESTRRIKTELPHVRVIGLSMYEEEEIASRMRAAGAEAFVSKTASSAELLKAIYGIAGRQ